jgi:hypothetical protein
MGELGYFPVFRPLIASIKFCKVPTTAQASTPNIAVRMIQSDTPMFEKSMMSSPFLFFNRVYAGALLIVDEPG